MLLLIVKSSLQCATEIINLIDWLIDWLTPSSDRDVFNWLHACRLPIIQGSSGAFVAVIVALRTSSYWPCDEQHSTRLNNGHIIHWLIRRSLSNLCAVTRSQSNITWLSYFAITARQIAATIWHVNHAQWLKWGGFGGGGLSPLLPFEPPAIVWAPPPDWIYKVLFTPK